MKQLTLKQITAPSTRYPSIQYAVVKEQIQHPAPYDEDSGANMNIKNLTRPLLGKERSRQDSKCTLKTK
jgi:hypothetical protein